MKRSEAVKDIKELIELNLETLKVIPDASLVADLVLYHLEQKGMLPPIRERKEDEDIRYDGINITKYTREWELE